MKKKRIVRTIQRIVALILLFSMFPISSSILAEGEEQGSTLGGEKSLVNVNESNGTATVQLTLTGLDHSELVNTGTDFVFIVDTSGSMYQNSTTIQKPNSSGGTTAKDVTRIDALKWTLAGTTSSDMNSDGIMNMILDQTAGLPEVQQNRVAIASFSSGWLDEDGIYHGEYGNYNKVYDFTSDLSTAQNNVFDLRAHYGGNEGTSGGTDYCLAMDRANQLLDSSLNTYPADQYPERKRVLIFLTDGEVTHYKEIQQRVSWWDYNSLQRTRTYTASWNEEQNNNNTSLDYQKTNTYFNGGITWQTGTEIQTRPSIQSWNWTTTQSPTTETWSGYRTKFYGNEEIASYPVETTFSNTGYSNGYAISYGFDATGTNGAYQQCIKYMAPNGCLTASDSTSLHNAFSTIVNKTTAVGGVNLYDMLTGEVDLTDSTLANATLWLQKLEITTDDEGNVTSSVWVDDQQIRLTDTPTTLVKSIAYDSTTKQIHLEMSDDFSLSTTQRLVLKFPIQLNDAAYQDAFENFETKNGVVITNINDDNITEDNPASDTNQPTSSYGKGYYNGGWLYVNYTPQQMTVPTTSLRLIKTDQVGQSVAGAVFSVVRNGTSGDSSARTFTSADDGTVTITGLSEGKYTLKETQAPEGYTADSKEYNFTVSKGKDGSLQVSGLDGLTKPDSGYQVVNQKNVTSAIIQKKVTGNAANLADKFTFTVKLLKADGNAYPAGYIGSAKIAENDVTYKVTGEDGTLTFYNGDNVVSSQISSGQKIEIENIVTGTHISVTESERGTYSETTVTGGTQDGKVFSSNSEAPNTTIENIQNTTPVVFTNTKNAPVITSFITDNSGMTGIALVSLTLIGLGAVAIYLKKRHV